MPLANRDKESLYPPGKLSLWFLATSGLLVASVFWMLADDFIRPWKTVQKDYFRKSASLLAIKRDVEAAKLDAADSQKRAKLRDLNRKVAAAKAAVDAAAVKALEKDLAEQKVRIAEDERDIKALKGSSAATVNAYENAKLAGDEAHAAKLSARQNGLANELDVLDRDLVAQNVKKAEIQTKLDALMAPVRAVEKERDDLLAGLASVSTQLGDAKARTESNQWRNLPVLDMITPSIKIEKVVLDNIHDDMVFATSAKVDMCMTCHRGIEGPLLSEREDDPSAGIGRLLSGHLRLKFGEKAWEKLSSNKGLAAFEEATSPSKVRAWLTGGKARLTDVFTVDALKAALGEENYRKDVEGKDLLDAFHVDAVQWAHPHLDLIAGPTSPHQVVKIGCTVCHAGVGRRLDFTRATHTPDSKEQAKAWEHEHQWDEAGKEYVDFPMLPARFVEGQCYKCHGSASPFLPKAEPLQKWESVLEPKMEPALDPSGKPVLEADGKPKMIAVLDDEGAPRLTFVLDKDGLPGFDPMKKTYLDREGYPLLDRSGKPLLDSIGKVRLDLRGRPPVDKSGRPILRQAKAPNAVDGSQAEVEGRWHAETYARGVAAIQEFSCTGCHAIKNFESRPGYGDHDATWKENGGDLSRPAPGSLTAAGNPKIGPDLTHIRDKTTEEWLQRWIGVPNSYRLDTRMPSFYRWRAHDDHYALVLGPDGKPIDTPLVVDPTPRDLAQIDVEIRALAVALIANSESRAATYPEIPAGDPKAGARTFYSTGCYACHIGPGNWDLAKGQWTEGLLDDGARFKVRGDELPPGPRLTSLGSKYTAPGAAKMLAAWIAEPRHYNSVTRMPNLLQDRAEMGADNVKVVRSALQIRADLVAYLLSFKDAAFDAQPLVTTPERPWTADHEKLLNDIWIERYGKTDVDDPKRPTITVEVAQQKAADRPNTTKLKEVGTYLISFRGCFGCHNTKGTEDEQPIGKELTEEGSQDLHKFDFGVVDHHEIPHTRWDWIDNKLKSPRIYDKDKFKPQWKDKLRMPKFNFTSKDREAVTAVVLGLVREPIKSGALPKSTPATEAIAKGRAVIDRYRCYQCHSMEGRRGVLTAEQAERGLDLWMLPPNLYGEGNRVRADWLFQFLKNPYLHQPEGVRPAVIQQMPMFRLSDEEASALVDYFNAVAGKRDRLATDGDDEPLDDTPYKEPVTITVKEKNAAGDSIDVSVTVRNLREEAKAFFARQGCIKCHLPKGAPVTANGEGASAPPFSLAAARLQRNWMADLLHNPLNQIPGTKMTAFWPLKAVRGKPVAPPDSMSVTYPQFLLGARSLDKPTNDDIADAQMAALARYLRFHYEPPAAATAPPEPASAGK